MLRILNGRIVEACTIQHGEAEVPVVLNNTCSSGADRGRLKRTHAAANCVCVCVCSTLFGSLSRYKASGVCRMKHRTTETFTELLVSHM